MYRFHPLRAFDVHRQPINIWVKYSKKQVYLSSGMSSQSAGNRENREVFPKPSTPNGYYDRMPGFAQGFLCGAPHMHSTCAPQFLLPVNVS